MLLRTSSKALGYGLPKTSRSFLSRNQLPRNYTFPSLKRTASTVTQLENYPRIGENLHGFTVKEKKHVPELHLTAVLLKHDKTDADYLHVARDDKNNVFGIGFKTNPPDATGVPHILEHTTLCGSEKSVSSVFGTRSLVAWNACTDIKALLNIDTRFAILSLRCYRDPSPIS